MIRVFVSGDPEDVIAVCALGNELQRRFHFQETLEEAEVSLEFSEMERNSLFTASRELGVTVSTYQSEGITRFSEQPRDAYLLSSALLGLVYWRALVLNPLLRIEDFIIDEQRPAPGRPACLFSARKNVQEYALAFEKPHVCKGCLEFFRCLGAEEEIAALLYALKHMARQERVSNAL